jgi:signal transduction histidine kinase
MSSLAPAYEAPMESEGAPRPLVVALLALAGGLAATFSFVAALRSDAVTAELGEPLVIAFLINWVTISYVLCGLVAWCRRPTNRFGPLLVAAGLANFLATLTWTTNDISFTLGQALDFLPPVLFLHVFLAYPSGRLESRFERAVVATAYVAAIALELVRMSLGGFGPLNLLEISSNPTAALWVVRAQLVVISALCLIGLCLLVVKRRASRPRARRAPALLVDAFGLGLVMLAVLFLSHAFEGPAIPQIRWATLATIGLAPLAFLIGLLHDRLARSAVGPLLVELRNDPGPGDLRDALARALRDPSLTLLYWLPEFGCYADLDGRAVELPESGGDRTVTLIDRAGVHVAALVHDAALEDERELLLAVTAAAGIALENAQLHVELRARLEELRGSRARIVEAGHKERQRLERNLHDGAQQRLVALSLELSLLEKQVSGDSDASKRVERARQEIAASLEELREIARGIHPAVVSGHGLEVALEQLAARAPVPVRLKVDIGVRLPEALEVAAYYLVSESLANVGKYAQASSATIEVARRNGVVSVEIVDDGIGGADTERGTGLRGLADRVESLDGRLRVWSPGGGGTRVRAEIPCAR